jgi:hypothetical protein
MKFYPIPDPRRSAVSREMLSDLRKVGIIPQSIGWFANEQHWIEATGVGAPSDGPAKYWRDNATIYSPQEQYTYYALDRNSDGSYRRLNLSSQLPSDGYSDATFNVLSYSTANFYRTYAQHFPSIPRVIARSMNRYEAGRLSFAAGPAEDYPLSLPSNMALRFNPQSGHPEAFFWEEYTRAFPIDWTPKLPPLPGTPGRLTDEELVSILSGILESQMNLKEKAAAIRQLAAR